MAGVGRIAAGVNQSITLTGGTLSVGNTTLATAVASTLEIATSGTGTISLDSASAFALDLFTRSGSPAVSGTSDLAKVYGTMSIAAGATLRVGNPNAIADFAEGDQWKLFDWTGLTTPATGTFTNLDLPTLSGLTWDVSRLYSDGIISVAVVPEPSRALLLLVAVLSLAGRRRRTA